MDRSVRRLSTLLVAAFLVVVGMQVPASAAPPSNDSIASATRLGTPPQRLVVDTRQATSSAADGSCVKGRSVWFRSRSSVTRTVRLSTVGSDYDTVLAVFRGTRAHRTRIACNDDAFATSAASATQVRLVAGQTYWIAVSACCSRSAPGGHLVLNTFLPAAEGLRATVTSVRTGVVSGRLVVQGTARCATPSEVEVDLSASQRVGGGDNVASGDGSTIGLCGPTASTWTTTVDSSTGWAFQKGRIAVTLSGFSSDGFGEAGVGPVTGTYDVTLDPNALAAAR